MIKAIQIQHDEALEHAMSSASKAGFEYVSMGFGSSKLFHEENFETELERIKSLLGKYGLKCIQTHLPYYHLLISAEELDDIMEAAIKRCITASAYLGAKWCVYHPRSAVSEKYDSEAAHEIKITGQDLVPVRFFVK